MTTTGRSPLSRFSPQRRSLLLGGLAGASATALATVGTGTAAASQPAHARAEPAPPQIDFDFDSGNFIKDLITTNAGGEFPSEDSIGPMDAPLYTWITHLFMMSWYDALAPYHPTAVGICSRIDRRPAGESATNRNKNIAGLYAGFRVLQSVFVERAAVMQQALTLLGLDPDDESEDPTSPIGIGNIAGKAIVRARAGDGMNHLGDMDRAYNGQPFEDYTGYEPVNTPYRLVNPSRWQPAVHRHRRRLGEGSGDKGVFVVQQFLTPQVRMVKPFTYEDPGRFELAPPRHTDHANSRRYKRAVDEILEASAGLTDEQKVKAEFFDHTGAAMTLAPRAAALAHDLDLDGWAQLFMTTSLARFDDMIAAWHQIHRYDAVRPFSAVRHVYGSSKVTAWGGVGMGTVDDMPADQWTSYLPVGDHPEYPASFTTICAAQAQAARRFLGDDVLDWSFPYAAGSALTEPGLVPAGDMELHYATWTDHERDYGMSRVWAGVHFRETIENSLPFGAQFGDRAHEFMQRHINGEVSD
ncbi:DUF6851 domain-containing protein [Streptomyces sp. SBT349]|uniref:DUF6851 domain-containing protein n=1 Tax=Streptomyces sp. SBT349 TaxID=1580539 RepID=UPI00066CCB83|nr:hypothetical protein [Streptomyces sp. SBT349]